MHDSPIVRIPVGVDAGDEYVEFRPAGEPAKGEFTCVGCGYGVVVRRELPQCPMCSERLWERAAWSPFTHVREDSLLARGITLE